MESNNTSTIESSERYTTIGFSKVLLLFGPATRMAAIYHIKERIHIIAGVIRTPEMASVHREVHKDNDSVRHPGLFKMCSFPLDNVMQQTKLLCMYKYVTHLYSTLCNEVSTCRKVDTFFLEGIPAGEVHQYSSSDDILMDKGTEGFCLCILIATETDKAFRGPISLSGVMDTCKFLYHMSAGDTCLLFGMSFSLP